VAKLVVDRWLLERRPAPDLVHWLVCVWRGDLGDAETPLPDERLDLVWVDEGLLWAVGPGNHVVVAGLYAGHDRSRRGLQTWDWPGDARPFRVRST